MIPRSVATAGAYYGALAIATAGFIVGDLTVVCVISADYVGFVVVGTDTAEGVMVAADADDADDRLVVAIETVGKCTVVS